MPEQAAGERTEEATPKRRREARRRGMVARSPELSSAVTFLAFVLLFPLLGSALVQALLDCARTSIASAQPAPVTLGEVLARVLPAVGPVLIALAPLMLIGVTFGVIASRLPSGLPLRTIGGGVSGSVWWVLGALILMPLMLGMNEMVFVIGEMQISSLIGHLIFGVIMGVVYHFMAARRA